MQSNLKISHNFLKNYVTNCLIKEIFFSNLRNKLILMHCDGIKYECKIHIFLNVFLKKNLIFLLILEVFTIEVLFLDKYEIEKG